MKRSGRVVETELFVTGRSQQPFSDRENIMIELIKLPIRYFRSFCYLSGVETVNNGSI